MDEINRHRKAAIVTWCYDKGRTNYGQVLQCYAMQSIVRRLGYETKVIRYRKRTPEEVSYQNDEINLDVDLYELCYRLENVETGASVRIFRFLQFIKENIRLSKQCYTKEEIEQECRDVEALFCGSDQIWNPLWFEDVYALNFGSPEQKRIAYAPSGVFFENSQVEPLYRRLGKYLDRFDLVTVREECGVDILKKYTKQEIIDVIDPTLLLSQDDWNQVAATQIVDEPYIFGYFLGRLRGQKILLRRIMDKYNVRKVVFVTSGFYNEEEWEADRYFQPIKEAGPKELLALIRDARAVCTDSFHGIALSIVYQKQFYVFKRAISEIKEVANLERQKNLLEKVGIRENRLVMCTNDLEKMEEIKYEELLVTNWWGKTEKMLKNVLE